MSSNGLSIKVEALSKCYTVYAQPRDRLKQFILPRLYGMFGVRRSYYREFWALQDVGFRVSKGETVGILGRNGSGKSTLLQMVAGTLTPTRGRVETNGRIAALLELGSGFNPEFTGRENVYLNALLLGLSRQQVDEKYDDIVRFADIGEYVNQPVKTYSSGMVARLAFAVSVQVEPDILIVDEALSVGDMAFQEKSITKMKQIRDAGTSVLFVSHSISAVRNFCQSAIWLDSGRVRSAGERLAVCDEYQAEMEAEIRRGARNEAKVGSGRNVAPAPVDSSEKTIVIETAELDRRAYRMGQDISLTVRLRFSVDEIRYGVGVIVSDLKGRIVTILNTLRDDVVLSGPRDEVVLRIPDNHFAPGEYDVTVSVCDENAMFSYDKVESGLRFRVEMERNAWGLAKVEGFLRCNHVWE